MTARRCKIRAISQKSRDGNHVAMEALMVHGHATAARRADLVRRDGDSGPGHLRVADRSGPAFKHLTAMREILQSCGRHAANPRQSCHNDEWHETEPGFWAAVARRSRRRGTGGCHAKAENIPHKKTQPGKVRREVAMGIAMLHRPGPGSGMSFAIGSAASSVIARSTCDEAIQPCPVSKRDSIAPRSLASGAFAGLTALPRTP
jgi:hypothetical protein